MLSITSGMRQWNRWLANGPKYSGMHSIQVRFHLSVNRNRWGKSMPCDKRKAVRLWQIFHSNNKKAFWHPKVNHVWALLFIRCSYLRCKKYCEIFIGKCTIAKYFALNEIPWAVEFWYFWWKIKFSNYVDDHSCLMLLMIVQKKPPFRFHSVIHFDSQSNWSIFVWPYGLHDPHLLEQSKKENRTHKPWDSNTFSMDFFFCCCCCDNMCWAHIRPCDELKAHNPTLFSLNGDAP